ncbi:MAG TPA: NAD(P)-binding domain-containing protein [Pyrinomonadaceae bacterium]|nr:NAD(P)-binding domain-containing protein [Pyrinomonadaceae bacterium]
MSRNHDERGGATHDYLIVGAGPAGLQLGYYMEKAGRDYLMLEAGEGAGTFFRKFPRHRTLISSNKIHTGYSDREVNLRWDWNSLLSDSDELLFKNYSRRYFPPADEMVRYLEDFARHFGLKVQYGAKVTRVSKGGDGVFEVADEAGRVYRARRVVMATGFTKPYVPPIPGIELAENYVQFSVDPEDYTNQRVLILGKGNSAFETADNLVETAAVIHMASPHTLKLAWRTHFPGHLRAVNNNILDTYQLKSQNALLDATVEKIERRADGKFVVSFSYAHANGEREDIVYDRVLACTGWRFDDAAFDDSCRPELACGDRLPAQTSEWESTNVKDLYFAGTLTQMRDYKKATSAFIHGFRYNARALYRILEVKHHGAGWPSRRLDPTPEALTEAIIRRVNTSSALWQQYGFLCDLLVVPEDGGEAVYYEEVPVDYVHDTPLGEHGRYYTITLDYGDDHAFDDPFNVNRIARDDVARADQSNFLHPIVKRYAGATLVREHHVIEDLAAEWVEPVHVEPLQGFFGEEVSRPAAGSGAAGD